MISHSNASDSGISLSKEFDKAIEVTVEYEDEIPLKRRGKHKEIVGEGSGRSSLQNNLKNMSVKELDKLAPNEVNFVTLKC